MQSSSFRDDESQLCADIRKSGDVRSLSAASASASSAAFRHHGRTTSLSSFSIALNHKRAETVEPDVFDFSRPHTSSVTFRGSRFQRPGTSDPPILQRSSTSAGLPPVNRKSSMAPNGRRASRDSEAPSVQLTATVTLFSDISRSVGEIQNVRRSIVSGSADPSAKEGRHGDDAVHGGDSQRKNVPTVPTLKLHDLNSISGTGATSRVARRLDELRKDPNALIDFKERIHGIMTERAHSKKHTPRGTFVQANMQKALSFSIESRQLSARQHSARAKARSAEMLERRAALEHERLVSTESAIAKREARLQMIQGMTPRQLTELNTQVRWLASVTALTSRSLIFRDVIRECKAMSFVFNRRNTAAKLIQTTYRRWKRKSRLGQFFGALWVNIFVGLAYAKFTKKKRALALVKEVLGNAAKALQFRVVVKSFRKKVLFIQRAWRRFRVFRAARIVTYLIQIRRYEAKKLGIQLVEDDAPSTNRRPLSATTNRPNSARPKERAVTGAPNPSSVVSPSPSTAVLSPRSPAVSVFSSMSSPKSVAPSSRLVSPRVRKEVKQSVIAQLSEKDALSVVQEFYMLQEKELLRRREEWRADIEDYSREVEIARARSVLRQSMLQELGQLASTAATEKPRSQGSDMPFCPRRPIFRYRLMPNEMESMLSQMHVVLEMRHSEYARRLAKELEDDMAREAQATESEAAATLLFPTPRPPSALKQGGARRMAAFHVKIAR